MGKDYEALSRRYRANQRLSLRANGRLAALEAAVVNAMSPYDAMDDFYGAAVYVPDPQNRGEVAVLHHEMSKVTEDHQQFAENILFRRRLVAEDTSVGDALNAGKTGIYPSHMADHDCLNVVAHDAHGPFITQLTFASGTPINARDADSIIHKSAAYGSIAQTVSLLRRDFGKNMSRDLAIEPPLTPNGALLHCDITGYKDILMEEGRHAAFGFTSRFRDTLTQEMKRFGGMRIREEGDGIWFGFSKVDHALVDAARVAQQVFATLRQQEPTPTSAIGRAKLKIGVASGYFDPSTEGPAFDRLVKEESLAFTLVQEMMKAAARQSDESYMTPDTKKTLERVSAVSSRSVPTSSTFMKEMHRIDMDGLA